MVAISFNNLQFICVLEENCLENTSNTHWCVENIFNMGVLNIWVHHQHTILCISTETNSYINLDQLYKFLK